MTNDLVFLSNSTVLVWLTVTHILFLAIPGLLGAADEWLHEIGSIRFKAHIHPEPHGYPHYLAA